MEQLDQGFEIKQIAANLGKRALAVRRKVAPIERQVLDGRFVPPFSLPIERATRQPRVYLAGFDVFRVDAKVHGGQLMQLCRERGFVGRYSLDGDVPSFLHPLVAARVIYMAKIEVIRAAEFVRANLNDFRGPCEPDSGTAFEVGFAAALNKPVWGYRTNPDPLIQTVPRTMDADESTNARTTGYLVGAFGLSVNLMLACAARIIAGGSAECLEPMKAAVTAQGPLSLMTGLAKR